MHNNVHLFLTLNIRVLIMNTIDVKKIRKNLNLTQQQLAEMIGVSRNTIVNYERGDVIPESKRALLCRITTNGGNVFEEEGSSIVQQKNELISSRIRALVDYFCEGNKSDFARLIGTNEANIRNYLAGKQPKFDTLSAMVEKFEINAEWLLTGKGEMLKGSVPAVTHHTNEVVHPDEQSIALYDFPRTNLVGFFSNLPQPVDRFMIPNMPKCDGAVPMRGESMRPSLNGGDIALYKRINVKVENILWGNMYLLSYEGDNEEEHIGIHTIRPSEDTDRIKLVNDNAYYPPMDIPMSAVKAMAIIKASIRYNTMS